METSGFRTRLHNYRAQNYTRIAITGTLTITLHTFRRVLKH